MIFAVAGGIGAISWLQEQVKASSDRLYLSNHFHDAINDFRWLADDIGGTYLHHGGGPRGAPVHRLL